jgi:surfactin synthase thioesterase subunit
VFQGFADLLNDVALVRPVELAGRGTRAKSEPYTNIQDAARDVATIVAAESGPGGWALFGHSMGGLIAYEAARLLQSWNTFPGRLLVVSACPPPQRGFGPKWPADMPDSAIIDFLREIGGLPTELALDDDALAYYAALVRSDEELLAGYEFRAPRVPLEIPVTVLWGEDDPVTSGYDAGDWREAAGGPVRICTLKGARHFFITEQAMQCAAIIRADFQAENGRPAINIGVQMYLELMKKVLTNVIYEDPPLPSDWAPGSSYDGINRRSGLDWPSSAHTMIGLRRLDNIQHCVEQILRDRVPGDFIETGVWRGGACIFLRALLRAYEVPGRRVWCADSFQGMPEVPEGGHPGDIVLATHKFNDVMGVSLDAVKKNFETYGLLDDQVRFLPGWFCDTLPTAPIRELALMRLDGDLYESTTDALVNLYPKLSPGGFVIIDDYLIDVCKQAVHDFRRQHGIDDEIKDIDGYGAYWRRSR